MKKAMMNLTPSQVCQEKYERIIIKRQRVHLLVKIVLLIVFVALFLNIVFGIGFAEGQSMYPTIRDGDIVLYYRIDKSYEISDVVTFIGEGDIRYFGRVVASGGDTVDMNDEGKLLINGNVQPEEVLYPTYKTEATVKFPYQVPDGEVFVLGDMRTGAVDSRDFGSVKKTDIDGIVFTIITRRGI